MKGDVVLAMLICSVYLQDVPMDFKSKVILCVLIIKYMDMYIKTEADLIWVNNQLKKMELENNNNVALRGSDSIEWDRSSDDEVCESL